MGVETLGLAAFLHNVFFFGSCRAFGSPRPVAGVLLVPSASLVIPGNSSMQGRRAVLRRNALENKIRPQYIDYLFSDIIHIESVALKNVPQTPIYTPAA